MEILLSSDEIANKLNQIKPTKIAVAFVGKDYSKFIDILSVENIIISPTIGSNPSAIGDIVSKIGWGKVHFINHLHSKIYIGDKFAVIGSANLSSNGLGADNLIEIGIAIPTNNKLYDKFDELIELAKTLYVDQTSKRAALDKLHLKWRSLQRYSFTRDKCESTAIQFKDYIPELHGTFKVAWWTELDEYDLKSFQKYYTKNVITTGTDINCVIKDSISLAKNDDININEWVLVWRCNKDGSPDKKQNLRWLYVHDIVPGGSKKYQEYPYVAVQKLDQLPPIQPPFELDANFTKVFKDVIAENKYSPFRPNINDEKIWRVKDTVNMFYDLITDLNCRYGI